MGLLGRIFKNRRTTFKTFEEKKFDGFIVRIISDKYLSEDVTDTIASVAYSCFVNKMSLDEIGCCILLYCKLSDPIIIDMLDYGIEIRI